MEDGKQEEKKLTAGMAVIERAANRLHGRSEDLVKGAEEFRKEIQAVQEIPPGSQEDVFLRSIPIWERKRRECRPNQDEFIHMLSDLVADGIVMFYHHSRNITPTRCICDTPVPYLHPSERGYSDFIAEISVAASHSKFPGMAIVGDGVAELFRTYQHLLHTADLLGSWFDEGPVHIDLDRRTFDAIDYPSMDESPFALLCTSDAERNFNQVMMLLRNGHYGSRWKDDIEYHRIAYWKTARDFPIGNKHDLARLGDRAWFALKMYPGLLEDVLSSLAAVSIHAPR